MRISAAMPQAQARCRGLQAMLKPAGGLAHAFPGVFVASGMNVRGDDGLGDAVGDRQPCHLEGFIEFLRAVVDARQQVAVDIDQSGECLGGRVCRTRASPVDYAALTRPARRAGTSAP